MPPDPAAVPPAVLWTWLGILVCISQSALFSGLNLAVFSVSRMRLEVEAAGGDAGALRVLRLRQRSNLVLTTVLWGNVGINVLLALLSDSVMSGVAAFLFSTVVITILGEIAPQAYFSRHALRVAARLSPLLRLYMVLLYPVAKPSSLVLDAWLGQEGPQFYRERDLREVIRRHIASGEAEIDELEGIGALNFLALDDLAAGQVGTAIDAESVIALPFEGDLPVFPPLGRTADDPFLRRVLASGRHWVVLTDPQGEPRLMLDAEHLLREVLVEPGDPEPLKCLHRPAIVRDPRTLLGRVIPHLEAKPVVPHRDEHREDVILVWGERRRLITGDDLLRRLMSGITPGAPVAPGGARG
jgi:metal transporter CNNM